MKALLLILGLTFSMTIFAEEAGSKLGETDGCTSAKAMENCECIVNGEGSEPGNIDGSGSSESGTATGKNK